MAEPARLFPFVDSGTRIVFVTGRLRNGEATYHVVSYTVEEFEQAAGEGRPLTFLVERINAAVQEVLGLGGSVSLITGPFKTPAEPAESRVTDGNAEDQGDGDRARPPTAPPARRAS